MIFVRRRIHNEHFLYIYAYMLSLWIILKIISANTKKKKGKFTFRYKVFLRSWSYIFNETIIHVATNTHQSMRMTFLITCLKIVIDLTWLSFMNNRRILFKNRFNFVDKTILFSTMKFLFITIIFFFIELIVLIFFFFLFYTDDIICLVGCDSTYSSR